MIQHGKHVKRLRSEYGYTLQEFADKLGFSVSYINQIENGTRPITSAFKAAITEWNDALSIDQFVAQDERLSREIHEALNDPLFAQQPPPIHELAQATATSPDLARGFMVLYHRLREDRELLQHVPDKSIASLSFNATQNAHPQAEVHDHIWLKNNYFDELDHAAEEVFEKHNLRIGNLEADLIALLWQEYSVRVQLVNDDSMQHTLRHYDAQTQTVRMSTQTPPERRTFHLGVQFAHLYCEEIINATIHDAGLSTAAANALLFRYLTAYFAAALLMPYRLFKDEAVRLRYDLEALEIRFGTTFESICQRLSTLQRADNAGIPFYFVRVDMAGNISKWHSASGFHFARFGGSCPLWNVHHAFVTPGTIQTQVTRLPDESLWFCMARTVTKAGGGYLANSRHFSIGLGCELVYADQLVYSSGIDLANELTIQPIGPGCRTCTHQACAQRAFAPATRTLRIDRDHVPFEPFTFD